MATTVDTKQQVFRGTDFIESLYQKPDVQNHDPFINLYRARVEVDNAITKHYQNAWWHVSFNEENSGAMKFAKFLFHAFTFGVVAFIARVILADTKPSVWSVLEMEFSNLKQEDTTLRNLSDKVKTYKELSVSILNNLHSTRNPNNKLVGHIIEAIKPEGFNQTSLESAACDENKNQFLLEVKFSKDGGETVKAIFALDFNTLESTQTFDKES